MASPISTAAAINRRPVRDLVCSWGGAAGLLNWGGMSSLLESGQLMLSLIFQPFARARTRWQPQSRGYAIPFMVAPCYPYELASKNKTIGEN
jgi:hypothetical protein